MPSSLSARSYVLLTPDIIKFGWDCPIYGKVKKVNCRTVQVEGLHDAEGNSWSVPKSDLLNRVVSAQEARSNTSGPILRQAIVLELEDAFHFGQVIALEDGEAVVQLMNETVEAPVAAITATAPVTALLLLNMAFNKTDWGLEDIMELNSSIVDKVCGSGTSVGSRDIGSIVEGLIDVTPLPDAKDEMHWRDPKTGAEMVFPLQHAIDYAFYVDGHVTPVPDTVGTAFCKPPSQPTRTATASRTRSRANRSGASLEPFNTLINEDDDYDVDAGDAIPKSPEQNSAVDSAGDRRSRKRNADDQGSDLLLENRRVNVGNTTAVDTDAEIAQLLESRPDLVERFLHLRAAAGPDETGSRTRHSGASLEAPRSLPEHSSISLGLGNLDSEARECHGYPEARSGEAKSKYAFTPSTTQRRIHELATAPRHQGKLPSTFIEGLINSVAVTFKPLPSVLTRTFDISFGFRGLSIMHFAPMGTLSEKAVRILTGGVNMQNFSATVPLPPAPQAETFDEVVDALLSLEMFGNEYFSSILSELVTRIVVFTKQNLRRLSWQKQDLLIVVYWINSLLENFRVEMEAGTSDGSHVKARCSVDDSDLRQLLHQIQQRHIQELQAVLASAPTKTHNGHQKQQVSHKYRDTSHSKTTRVVKSELVKSEPAIPPEIYALLPVKNDKRLCLPYISNAGFRSSSDTVCHATSRAHFIPDSIDKLVRDFIAKKFGGIKEEYTNL